MPIILTVSFISNIKISPSHLQKILIYLIRLMSFRKSQKAKKSLDKFKSNNNKRFNNNNIKQMSIIEAYNKI